MIQRILYSKFNRAEVEEKVGTILASSPNPCRVLWAKGVVTIVDFEGGKAA